MKKKRNTVTLTRSQFEAVLRDAYAVYHGFENWNHYSLTRPCSSGINAIAFAWEKAKTYGPRA